MFQRAQGIKLWMPVLTCFESCSRCKRSGPNLTHWFRVKHSLTMPEASRWQVNEALSRSWYFVIVFMVLDPMCNCWVWLVGSFWSEWSLFCSFIDKLLLDPSHFDHLVASKPMNDHLSGGWPSSFRVRRPQLLTELRCYRGVERLSAWGGLEHVSARIEWFFIFPVEHPPFQGNV